MTRDQKLIAVFTAIAVCAGGIVVARLVAGGPGPGPARTVERVAAPSVSPRPEDPLSVQFVGDTLLGETAQRRIDRHGYDWPLAAVRKAITADVSVAVGEAPFTNREERRTARERYTHTSRPAAARALARAGIDALALANTHVFDAGTGGLSDTVRYARAAGIATFGAGADLASAERPLLTRSRIGTVGVVGFARDSDHDARTGTPGTVALSMRAVQRGIRLARAAGATWVVASVHWSGDEARISGEQRWWARQFARAGYAMVIGTGGHHSQPVEIIGSMPVFYGIGDFVSGAPGSPRDSVAAARGLLVNLELSERRGARLSVRCVVTDNRVVGYQPRLCTPTEAHRYLPTLHPRLVMQRDQAVLPCRCFVRGGPS